MKRTLAFVGLDSAVYAESVGSLAGFAGLVAPPVLSTAARRCDGATIASARSRLRAFPPPPPSIVLCLANPTAHRGDRRPM